MKIIENSLKNKNIWQKELLSILRYDIYHTSDYHSLSINNDTKSYLLSFSEGKYKICFPILMRKIKNSLNFDCTSTYGYNGLLSNNKLITNDIKSLFKETVFDYFSKKNVISAFSRLHPLMNESENFPHDMGIIENVNTTISIDLNLLPKQQVKYYSCSLRRQLNKLYDSGITVRIARRNEFHIFISLYYKTMQRLSAKEEYYFPEIYFEKMMNATDFQSYILFAEYKNEIIGGGLFTCCNEFMQYHLGAVPEEFLHLSPLKVIIDTARELGYKLGMKHLHLGGGYNGKDDNLFEFKSRFSKERHTFKVWKWIINQSEYDKLVIQRFGSEIPQSKYFPLYRY